MGTIRLHNHQDFLIAALRQQLHQASDLGALLQTARSAGAGLIRIVADNASITLCDDGKSIEDMQALLDLPDPIGEREVRERSNASLTGVLSALYFATHLSVHCGQQGFSTPTDAIIRGEPIAVHAAAPRIGNEFRLDGVESPRPDMDLPQWVRSHLRHLCQAFPVRVIFNGVELPRPLAHPSLAWRETPIGRVLLDLDAPPHEWQCFRNGLPIGPAPSTPRYQAVLLHDGSTTRPPDPWHPCGEGNDHGCIQATIDPAYRAALIEAKERLSDSEFVVLYWEACLASSHADLLNDVPFAPRAWFRDWDAHPPGYQRFGQSEHLSGLAHLDSLDTEGVWRIHPEGDEDHAAEVYVCARGGLLLEERRLDAGHWLFQRIRSISSEQVRVYQDAVLHEDIHATLYEDDIELVLVRALNVRLNGEPDPYAVNAVRKDGKLVLTEQAGPVTRLVSDYVFDGRHDEAAEATDAQTILAFIAAGSTQGPARIVNAVLPPSLRYQPNPGLAGATVHLRFGPDGRLQAIDA